MRKSARDLLNSIAHLRSTLQSQRMRLGLRLAEHFAAASAVAARAAASDTTVAYDPVFDLFDVKLAAADRELTGAEHALEACQGHVVERRQERQRAVTSLYSRQSAVARFCRSQPTLQDAGVAGPTAQSPEALIRQARRTLELLRDLARNPPALTPGVSIDAAAVADDLVAGVPRLEAAMIAVDRTQARVTEARERANRAFAAAGEAASWVGRALESICGLAGEDQLASRIRRCWG